MWLIVPGLFEWSRVWRPNGTQERWEQLSDALYCWQATVGGKRRRSCSTLSPSCCLSALNHALSARGKNVDLEQQLCAEKNSRERVEQSLPCHSSAPLNSLVLPLGKKNTRELCISCVSSQLALQDDMLHKRCLGIRVLGLVSSRDMASIQPPELETLNSPAWPLVTESRWASMRLLAFEPWCANQPFRNILVHSGFENLDEQLILTDVWDFMGMPKPLQESFGRNSFGMSSRTWLCHVEHWNSHVSVAPSFVMNFSGWSGYLLCSLPEWSQDVTPGHFENTPWILEDTWRCLPLYQAKGEERL